MIENFLMGAGAKLCNNLVMEWIHSSSETAKLNAKLTEKEIEAHVELVKESNRHVISALSRAVIFTMLAATWCWMGVAGLAQENVTSTALVPQHSGFFSRLFTSVDLRPIEIKGTTLLYQWFQIMEMMMGAFVMPSRKAH